MQRGRHVVRWLSVNASRVKISTVLQALSCPLETRNAKVIDVRSPSEFAQGHIPGAISLPLLDDSCRKQVGIAYKERGRSEAIQVGLSHVGPKLPKLLECMRREHASEPEDGTDIFVYCSRGGMRSESMSWLLNLCGYKSRKLHNGYKSFRGHVVSSLGPDGSVDGRLGGIIPINVLAGHTGVGKTAILSHLKEFGEDIVCLETLARHKGSAFGRIGETAPQPSTEMFENQVLMELEKILHVRKKATGERKTKPIWLEHEGNHIGKVSIPWSIQQWISTPSNGKTFVLEMEQSLRILRLVEDYCGGSVDDLIHCIDRPKGGLEKRLGNQRSRQIIRALQAENFPMAGRYLLEYYDKLYKKWGEGSAKNGSGDVVHVRCPTHDAYKNASLLLGNN